MALITISDLEEYLGTTFDSDTTVVYQSIIDAVSKYIECYTGQNFTDDVYREKVSITDGLFSLKNKVQYVYGAFYGRQSVIEVTGGSANASISRKEPLSISRSMRSRAVRRPRWCCASMRSAPPPSRLWLFSLRNSWILGSISLIQRSKR